MEEKVDFLTEYDKDDLFGGHALTDPIKTIEVYQYDPILLNISL